MVEKMQIYTVTRYQNSAQSTRSVFISSTNATFLFFVSHVFKLNEKQLSQIDKMQHRALKVEGISSDPLPQHMHSDVCWFLSVNNLTF